MNAKLSNDNPMTTSLEKEIEKILNKMESSDELAVVLGLPKAKQKILAILQEEIRKARIDECEDLLGDKEFLSCPIWQGAKDRLESLSKGEVDE